MDVEGFGAPTFTQLFTGKIKHFGSEMQMWGMSREVFLLATSGKAGPFRSRDE